jgi:hypothetical protein
VALSSLYQEPRAAAPDVSSDPYLCVPLFSILRSCREGTIFYYRKSALTHSAFAVAINDTMKIIDDCLALVNRRLNVSLF